MKLLDQRLFMVDDVNIVEGSGFFIMQGGVGRKDNSITVYYYRPSSFTAHSKILWVIPGAGRNADSYRDAWIEEAEKFNLLILSPMYPERKYSFEDYHLGGLIAHSNLRESITPISGTHMVRLDEENFHFEINEQSAQWIFEDFDRIFDTVVNNLSSNQSTYDIFGHSAGGHILHRMALFHHTSKADRIMAANPSFYTLPSFEEAFPFGLKDAPIDSAALIQAFRKKLVLLLGEEDNEKETNGTFLRSSSADKQGLHRLARGRFFFDMAQTTAEQLKAEYHWKLHIVPEVGHDHRKMGDAAARYLYGNSQ